jgi:GAF domain-containing protein
MLALRGGEMGGTDDLERDLAQSRAREAALAQILAVISRTTTDLEPVFETILRKTLELARADTAAIQLRQGDVFRGVAGMGGTADENEIDAESLRRGHDFIQPGTRATITGRVAADGRTVHIPDIRLDEDYDSWARELPVVERTMLGVPLFRGREVIGVVIARRRAPRPFSAGEIALLEAFAHQAAIAIENVRLFSATKESLERQMAISEVLKEMSQSVFDLGRVLESVAMNAVRLCAADNGSIAQLKSDGWRIVANAGDFDREGLERNWGNQPIEANRRSVTGRVLLEKRTVAIVDVAADPDYDAGAGLFNVRSIIGVPLTRGGEIVGVLILRRDQPKPFRPEEINLLETFADQASIAIENVRLFDETKDQLERETATAEILRVTAQSTFEVQPVLDAVIASATRLAGAENGFVYQVDGDVLRMTAAVGEKAELMREWQRTNPIGANDRGTSTGRAFSEGRTVHIPDVHADPEYRYWEAQKLGNFRTLLTVPLVRQGTTIGVIAMWRTEMKPFSDKEVNLVRTFADQAAIAIANVELFQTVERQRGELSRFLSPQVAALVTSAEGAKMLEGHRRQITVAFCDLRGFTAFAETAEPEEVLGVLREYHRFMGELIVEHQGTLEHFAGDGMMIFFNDPVLVDRHELQAVRMACGMRERFEEMARAWQKRGYELGFGVGIATGYATLGRIGFEGRYDYGAVGNVVILAQRLSAEAKAGQILVSQRVQAALETDAETTSVGDLTLKGFTRPIPAFAAESVKMPTPART